ncbi:tectonin beta-propeller repeat-containing protein 1-like [Sinocyclocheilus grahami]|uniref:tectonin beta-propeller repeat-containing protein 1-like n=1 Tax=Sinocyclocheilus grahami TaxID=75366 RepID=UPI0007ACDBE4|nr:PREDICTED: tectonin beta-propeller repeat-containing protein 1-like [Sinocyclocheilus grahami]
MKTRFTVIKLHRPMMSGSQLWAVDVYGRGFSLWAAGGRWRRAADLLLELKRVTGSQHCCWGIGCDHQVYLHVYPSQVPIRHQEETYENQRWNPVDGYTDTLLPTDRWQWTDESGLNPQPLHSFVLPSANWEWEGDWYVDDESCGRESSETGLWFRTGIRQQNPEGTRWEPIQVPREVAQVSAGPKDLLWLVLWDGQLLARTGISKDCPKGSSWELVQPPNQKGAVHVAVGITVVWAITKDNKVWFRRGVNSHNPTGSGWISIGGEMVMLSMGPNDQVWGVGSDDRTVYFRHGVTATEVTGRSWVAVSAQLDGSESTNHSSDPGPLSPSITPALSALDTDTRTRGAQHDERDASIEKSVRVTRGCMCWWRDWMPHQWEDVSVMLEQVTGAGAQTGDILYLYYTHDQEKKYLYAVIKEVTALVPVFRDSLYTMAVYTPERTKQRLPILLATPSQQDFNTWLSLLNESCCASRGLGEHPSKQALWAVTCKGDVMVHEPSPSLEAPAQYLPCDHMYRRQVPAHLLCVESNSLGVVWGIAHDHTAWVYTGGGGGPSAQGNENLNQAISDVRSVSIYENQRWNPMAGYTDKGLPTDRYMWSDASGLRECTKDNTSPPSPQWTWVSDWAVDYGVPGGTDKEGWQYAADFQVTFHGYKTMKDFVRRRRWARLGNSWLHVGTDQPFKSICIGGGHQVWAIARDGAVFYRGSVSAHNPGNSWLHVGTDQPFKSICIGGGHQVWAIARDGAVFYRGSVSAHNPAGECWYHIPSPPKQTLRQVSVGRTSVYAVDENNNLWYRQGLTPSYPQGSAWELISSNVCKVSVGPLDQVWIIADKVPGYPSESSGTVCHRLGVKPMQPKGLSWDFGIGGRWEHLSVRGNSIEAQRMAPRSPMPSRTQSQVNGNVVGC